MLSFNPGPLAAGGGGRGFHVLRVEEGGWAAEENDLEGHPFQRRVRG